MPWRYQPVICSYKDSDEQSFWIIEVYFDKGSDRLKMWSSELGIKAAGDSLSGLTEDLSKMLVDARAWVPVPFESLRVGMTFERALSKEQRERIADFYDDYAEAMDAIDAKRHAAESNKAP